MIRLGLDIGTNSIGWWIFQIKDGRPVAVIDGGVRIFSDGRVAKTGASLAVDRRNARAARRRRDRYLHRRAMLMKRLAQAGLMPDDPIEAKKLEQLDPFTLRTKGLDEKLPLNHLGRAIFHLNQRRGFKSNRKTDGANQEAGKIALGTARLDQAIMAAGARTFGEFLHKRRLSAASPRQVPAVRTRLTLRQEGDKTVEGYDYYPDRRHLEDEFQKLWEAQASFWPDILTDALRDVIFETVFHQRPLKEPEIGRCLFLEEKRLPKAHPLTQRRVIYETVNNLRVERIGQGKRPLTLDERNTVILALDGKTSTKSLSSMKLTLKSLGKTLKLRSDERFTLASAVRDAIACDPVRASLSHPDRLGANWSKLDTDAQWRLIERLRRESDRDVLIAWLRDDFKLDADHAENVADAALPEGYGRIGETATRNILAHLMAEVLTYNQAVEACGWHHSSDRTGEFLDALPYYGAVLDRHVIPGTQDPKDDDITRFGRITNPTVHIGLNQLRRLVNKLIEHHGKPDEIVVELARDLKQSKIEKDKASIRIRDNTAAAIKRSDKLAELGVKNSGANRVILRLWEDLGEDPLRRFCPYTGHRISAQMLFNGACDIDHILPYSRTLDDSFSNRTLCLREANRQKRNLTPHEAWGSDAARWDTITANLKYLPENKRWRFQPDAMERFEGDNNFQDRALVDTQYLSRISRTYLDTLYTEGGHVWVVAGRLTEMLRRHWGLNSLLPDHNRGTVKAKNRQDHRHHAIDAAVIAATDRGLIKQIADAANNSREDGQEALAKRIGPPWKTFREDIGNQLERIIISHRADHGRIDFAGRKSGRDSTTGQLHNDTAYGLTSETHNDIPIVVTRKALADLTPSMLAKIRDPALQSALYDATRGLDSKEFANALVAFSEKPGPYHGTRRVRIAEPIEVIKIRDAAGKSYKGYKGGSNHCYEVWRLPDGKYTHHVVQTFDAHQGVNSRPHPAAKRIMRLFKNDMVALNDSKFGPVVASVAKFDSNGTIEMVPHTESNADERYQISKKARKKNPEIAKDDVYIRLRPSTLIKAGGRRIFVDEIGQVRDPGPRS